MFKRLKNIFTALMRNSTESVVITSASTLKKLYNRDSWMWQTNVKYHYAIYILHEEHRKWDLNSD